MTATMALVRRDDGQLVFRTVRARACPGDIPATLPLVAALIGDALPPDALAAHMAEWQMRAHIERRGHLQHHHDQDGDQ